MVRFAINQGQKPSRETLERLSVLKDEDIVYDEDCPEMTPKMEKHLSVLLHNEIVLRKQTNEKKENRLNRFSFFC